ncbi:MAG: single-stranded-DNA-specific exonuclease RecJ [Oscillospiraceae bacterium]|nr:single-stranded-DNA-specific exonuclease RecJ [Oscillospiraceae bacterium]
MRYDNWKLAAPDRSARAALEREGVHPLVASVLSARGLCSVEQAKAFLKATDTPLHPSNLMRDLDAAALRVRQGLERGEHMAVYGDYDVDGITATCLLTSFLRGRGGQVTAYIPDRLEEGYGLNCEAISALAEQGVTLIITVDCGITAVEEVAYAARLGVDVVVTDHHECKAELPEACAVVDPHRPDCPYPFKGLAGVGVALKLAMAVAGAQGSGQVLDEYADLAAIGTVADVMPMVGENRTIVQLGLRLLGHPRRLGLAMLVREAGMENRPLNSVSIGYALAPRINAAGRMGSAGVAVELLLTQDADRAAALAQELCRLNKERQEIETEIFEQCVQTLGRQPQKDAIVLADAGWHQGVVGIVASRLTEQFACPAFMICLSGGVGKGSCRSFGGVNLFAVLEGCQDLLVAFGGHELAAGFTVREENIPALARRIAQQVRLQAGQGIRSELEVDVMVDDPGIMDNRGVELLERMEPYGAGNPRPVLALSGARVMSRALVGSGRHLKMKLDKQGYTLAAIFFSAGDWLPEVGSRVDVAFYPQINEYRGARSVQLHLVDMRPSPSRTQMERDAYEAYRAGAAMTAEQARCLIPVREEFVALWRYLGRQPGELEATPAQIARALARNGAAREDPAHIMVCLDVMRERGLIFMEQQGDKVRVTINPDSSKVDLEQSDILIRLHRAAEQ